MAGLLRRVAGGALAGVGQGIVAQATARRQETLERIRQSAAERRHRSGIEADDRRHRSTLDARAAEGRLGRASAERIAAIGASGRTPGRLYELGEDPLTGRKTYGTRKDALAAGRSGDARTRADEIDEAADDMTGWWPEFLGGKRDPSAEERGRAYDIARKNPQMSPREALMRAMGMGGRGDEPGQGGEAAPPGRGSDAAPYEITSQAHADWLKKHARSGTAYRYNGKTYRVK